jgi:hypothetical protein
MIIETENTIWQLPGGGGRKIGNFPAKVIKFILCKMDKF